MKTITPFGCQLTKQILLLKETRSSSSTEMLLTHVHLSSNTSHLMINISPFIRYCGYIATATALCEDGSFTNSGQFLLTSAFQDNQCELAVLLLWPRMVLFHISFKQRATGHLMHSKFTSARTPCFCRQSFSPERRLPGPYNPSDPSSFASWSFPSSISSLYLTYITLSCSSITIFLYHYHIGGSDTRCTLKLIYKAPGNVSRRLLLAIIGGLSERCN